MNNTEIRYKTLLHNIGYECLLSLSESYRNELMATTDLEEKVKILEEIWEKVKEFNHAWRYMFNGKVLISDDSSMERFAYSIFEELDIRYTGTEGNVTQYENFKENRKRQISRFIYEELSETKINYEELMCRYRDEIGELLYQMDDKDYVMEGVYFFGEAAKDSFEYLVQSYCYIMFDEWVRQRNQMEG